ncbi:hypothetical protein B1R94_02220 [Mycolicibacterium litorale]|nr:hypothetical protein B1R94_02220 [Mycolicibacterium litorale]
MPHFRVDDAFHSHPKAQRVGDEAVGFWVRAGSFCMAYLTDGFVPDWWVKKQPKGLAKAKKLVEAELWHDGAERDGEKGYQFHEFVGPGRQDSKEQIEADRKASRERKAKSRASQRESRQASQGESRRDTAGGADENELETGVKNTNTKGTTDAVHMALQSKNGAQKNGHETNGQNVPTSDITKMSRRDSHRPSQGESRRSPGYTQPNPTHGSTSVETSHGGVALADAQEKPPSPHCSRHPNGTDKPCHACGAANDARKAWDTEQANTAAARRRAFWTQTRPATCCDPNGMTDLGNGVTRCPNHDWSALE